MSAAEQGGDEAMNIKLHYDVPGDDFTRAGEASGAVKRTLKQLGFSPDLIRRVSIAMYEAEINMVIHAGGGEADVEILPDRVSMVLTDHGPGIPDVEQAMQEGPPLRTTSVPWASARAWGCPTSKNTRIIWISRRRSAPAPA